MLVCSNIKEKEHKNTKLNNYIQKDPENFFLRIKKAMTRRTYVVKIGLIIFRKKVKQTRKH